MTAAFALPLDELIAACFLLETESPTQARALRSAIAGALREDEGVRSLASELKTPDTDELALLCACAIALGNARDETYEQGTILFAAHGLPTDPCRFIHWESNPVRTQTGTADSLFDAVDRQPRGSTHQILPAEFALYGERMKMLHDKYFQTRPRVKLSKKHQGALELRGLSKLLMGDTRAPFTLGAHLAVRRPDGSLQWHEGLSGTMTKAARGLCEFAIDPQHLLELSAVSLQGGWVYLFNETYETGMLCGSFLIPIPPVTDPKASAEALLMETHVFSEGSPHFMGVPVALPEELTADLLGRFWWMTPVDPEVDSCCSKISNQN